MSNPTGGSAVQIRVFLTFFIYSLMLGAILPRLGDLQVKMGIGESALGLSLLGFAIGTQIALMFAGPVLDKIGFRAALLICIPFIGVAETAATLAPTAFVMFFCLLGAGLAIGTTEIIINLEADRTEHLIKKRIMNRSHAFWSFGFFAAGLAGSAAVGLKLDPTVHVFGVTVFVTIAIFLSLAKFTPAPARRTDAEKNAEGPKPKFVRPTVPILFLVAFTLSAMLAEGASADWSVIFMRDSFQVSPFINSIAFSVGALSQAVTRFFADGFVEKYGPTRISQIMISILGLGLILVVTSPAPAVALAGFALVGMGSSSIFPLAMSAAAQRTDRPAATNVASLAQLSFIVFLIAPPLLGFIAEHFGIRTSFAICLPLVVLSWFTISSLTAQKS